MIELRDLALDAADGHPSLAGLTLRVPEGGNLLVTGPSGCGKSRLLRVMAGTERPARGRARVGGLDVWPGDGALALMGRVRIGFAFGSGGLLSNLSLRENLALPLTFLGLQPTEIRDRSEAALDRLGLKAVADLRPHAVSASARRHANLGRVLVLDPRLILLDDPLEGLDAADRAVAQALIQAWAADGARTLVIAAEEPDAFNQLEADRLQLPQTAMSAEFP